MNRQNLRNDDLDAFQQILIGLAEGATWAIDSGVADIAAVECRVILQFQQSQPNEFRARHPRIAASGIIVPFAGVDLRQPISLNPDRLLLPPEQALLGARLYGSNKLLAGVDANTTQRFEENPYKDKYRVVVSPYLSNTAIRTPDNQVIAGQNPDGWYLLGDPAIGAIIRLGFLHNRQVPFIEQGQLDFQKLSIGWRGYHDWGLLSVIRNTESTAPAMAAAARVKIFLFRVS